MLAIIIIMKWQSHQCYEDQDALWTKVNSSREKVNSKVLSQSTWQE